MRTYQFAATAPEGQRDAVVLSLRKGGYKACRETDTLFTTATLTGIGLCYGTTSVVNVLRNNA